MTAPDALPVGGTTGLSHVHSHLVEEAARWLAEKRTSFARAIIPELRDRFGLTITEAVEAAVLAAKIEYLEGTRCAS